MSQVSGIYWHVTGAGLVIFWLLFAAAFGLLTARLYFLFRLVWLGQKEPGPGDIRKRIKLVVIDFFLQRSSLRSVCRGDFAGIGHALLVYGFGLFIIGYFIFIILGGGFGLDNQIAGSAFEKVYLTIMDITGLLIIVGVVWAVVKRYVVKPPRLEASTSAGGSLLTLILGAMFVLVLLHYSIEAFGIAAFNVTGIAPPFGAALAGFLSDTGLSRASLVEFYTAFWWANYAVILGFMVYAPHSKHLHPITSIFSVLLKPSGTKGAMKPIELDRTETFGVSGLRDFTRKHLLDLYSCTECGRCSKNCPAQLSGKVLDPREVILNLKEHLLKAGPNLLKAGLKNAGVNQKKPIPGGVLSQDVIWACLNCGACQEVCPVYIEQMVKIVEMKRNLVLQQGTLPRTGEEALNSIETNGHPWRGTSLTRISWSEGLDVNIIGANTDIDMLYWVGCTTALDERCLKLARAIASVLKQAGINFGILGMEESCCGDPARRLGSEYLFQLQAERNIDLMKSSGVKTILTGCPHCYNTIKNEYPQFGGEFEVIHHAELIARLMQQGKIQIAEGYAGLVTYHDACYLGRFNGIYTEPRYILNSIPNVTTVEMERSRDKSFCCGAGGGHLWMEEQKSERRINEMRFEQALQANAQTLATSCPYCLLMLEDAAEAKGNDKLRVMDIVEIVEQSRHAPTVGH